MQKNSTSTALPKIFINKSKGTSPLGTSYEELEVTQDDDFNPSTEDEPFDTIYDNLINDDYDAKLFDMVAVIDHQIRNGQLQVQVQWAT